MLEELIKLEPDFNVSIFHSKVSNIFVLMMNAIMFQDITRAYASLNEDVRMKVARKINELKTQGLTQLYDELNVKSVQITDVNILEDRFVVNVLLVSRYLDYRINSTTKQYVDGNNQSRVEKNNYLTFELKKNHKKIGNAAHCPNCGANIDFNYTGLCTYCNSQINKAEYDWILTKWEA